MTTADDDSTTTDGTMTTEGAPGEFRAELARLVHATRLLVAGEREAGIVTLPGLPGAADPSRVPCAPTAPTPPRERNAVAASDATGTGAREVGDAVTDAAITDGTSSPSVPAHGASATPPRAPVPAAPTSPAAATGAAARGDASSPASSTFVPRVRPLALPSDWRAPFGDLPERVAACRRCSLGEKRSCTVFGEGRARSELVFCGEAPGYEEDLTGRPFVGAAGELLTAMIERGMQMRREDVFILNTLKCRPPRNRAPLAIEVSACRPYLEEQLAVIRPKVIVALGNHAVRALLGESPGISRIRGRVIDALGAKVVPTYHPAYLLRNTAAKREAWEDLKTVLALLGRAPG